MRVIILKILLIAYFFIDLIDFILTPLSKGIVILLCSLIGLTDLIIEANTKIKRQFASLLFLIIIALFWSYHSIEKPFVSFFYIFRLSGFMVLIFTINTVKKSTRKELRDLKRFYLTIAVLTCFGIIVDFNFPQIIAPFQKYDIERSYFLLGTSSNVFICLSPAFLIILRSKNNLSKLFGILLFLCAGYLSGSRIAIILFTVILMFHLRILHSKIFLLVLVTILIIYSSFLNELINAFILFDAGNNQRIAYWLYFFDILSPSIILSGEGLGYLLTEQSIFATKHFESSLISMIIEGGLLFAFYLFFYWFERLWKIGDKLLVALFFGSSLLVPMFPGPLFGLMSGIAVLPNKKENDQYNNNNIK